MSRIPDRTPKGWRWRDTDDPDPGRAPEPELTERDNPERVLLDRRGGVLARFSVRRRVPFGYQPAPKEDE